MAAKSGPSPPSAEALKGNPPPPPGGGVRDRVRRAGRGRSSRRLRRGTTSNGRRSSTSTCRVMRRWSRQPRDAGGAPFTSCSSPPTRGGHAVKAFEIAAGRLLLKAGRDGTRGLAKASTGLGRAIPRSRRSRWPRRCKSVRAGRNGPGLPAGRRGGSGGPVRDFEAGERSEHDWGSWGLPNSGRASSRSPRTARRRGARSAPRRWTTALRMGAGDGSTRRTETILTTTRCRISRESSGARENSRAGVHRAARLGNLDHVELSKRWIPGGILACSPPARGGRRLPAKKCAGRWAETVGLR